MHLIRKTEWLHNGFSIQHELTLNAYNTENISSRGTATQATTWRSARFSRDSILILFHPEHHQSMSSGYSDRQAEAHEPIRRRLLHNAFFEHAARDARPAGRARPAASIHVRAATAALPVARPRRNVTVVMAYNWTRKISPLRRPIRLCSRISWDAIGNTQLPSSSYLDYKDGEKETGMKERKKGNEAVEERQCPRDRQTDGRMDRRANSGR